MKNNTHEKVEIGVFNGVVLVVINVLLLCMVTIGIVELFT